MTERRSIQRFEIRAQLGTGGIGTVYRAHDPQLERDVAIKVLSGSTDEAKSELSTVHTIDLRATNEGNPGEDLLREARMMARLSHPNVVPVYEVGLEGASVFVVMEHVDGANLRAWLAAAKRSTNDILAVFAQAAEGLAAAHARGIVHRDFKPDNVLIGEDGRARVADFGLSKLSTTVQAGSSLVRMAEGAGTPRYMAPELWEGQPATTASDVFAYCTALVEAFDTSPKATVAEIDAALRTRGVPARSRELVLAGLADDPAKRPVIGQLVAALRVRAGGRALVFGGSALAVGALAVGGFFALRSEGLPECTEDPTLYAERWNADVRAQLREKYKAAGDKRVDHLIAQVDERVAAITKAHREVCETARDGAISELQRAQQESCLERRAIELAARARAILKRPRTLEIDFAQETLAGGWQYKACDEINAPPLGPDRAKIEALHARYWELFFIADYAASPDLIGELQREARQLEQYELEVMAAISRGQRLNNLDRLDEAAEVLTPAYHRATEIRSTHFEVLVLLERSTLASLRGDFTAAKQLAELALEKARKPRFPAGTLASAHHALAAAQLRRGEYPASLATARAGLGEIQKSGKTMPEAELMLRTIILNALGFTGQYAEQLAYAKQSVLRSELFYGGTGYNHAITLEMLARAHANVGEAERAFEVRKQAHEIMVANYGKDHTRVVAHEVELTNDHSFANRLEEAHAIAARAVKLAEANPAGFKDLLPWMLGKLATTTFDLGRHEEGRRTLERTVEVMIDLQGREHPQTTLHRRILGEYRFEAGDLDGAQREYDAASEAAGRRADPTDKESAFIRGENYALLAIARGKPREAEKLARDAIAELAELKAGPVEQRYTKHVLGAALVAQGRFAEAQAVLEESLQIAKQSNVRADHAAITEVELARAEYGLGKRTEAIARATRARDVLAKWPGQPKARADVAKFLATAKR